MRIDSSLYVKDSAKAVKFYQEVFGLELGYHVQNPDGSFFHSELYKDGVDMLLSVIESPHKAGMEQYTMQLSVTLDSEEEVNRAYKLLSENAKIMTPLGPLPWTPCCAELVDQFGVWWYITAPQHMPPADYDPNLAWDASMYKKPE